MNPKKTNTDELFDFSEHSVGRRDVSGETLTRTRSTLSTYASHARALFRWSAPDAGAPPVAQVSHVVGWFLDQRQVWSRNTIKAYRAALHTLLERATALQIIDLKDFSKLTFELNGETSKYPLPRPTSAMPRTSARKRKSFDLDEYSALMAHLKKSRGLTPEALRGLLYFGPQLGLRFIEYFTAEMDGETLQVTCAKATNGRAVAPVRTIDLSAFTDKQRAGLRSFLIRLRRLAQEAGSIRTFRGRLAKALCRACAEIGIRKIALYTLRHQALATAKQTLPPQAVAAFAGHKTVRTAAQHYASKRTGWRRPFRAAPTADMIALVATPPPRTARSSSAAMRF